MKHETGGWICTSLCSSGNVNFVDDSGNFIFSDYSVPGVYNGGVFAVL